MYREAYQNIADEMRGIIARNTLAEEEADRLSKFNAEIIGHHNPTQRIYYVDRIRKELAETKQVCIFLLSYLEYIGRVSDPCIR